MNQIFNAIGIPSDSAAVENALGCELQKQKSAKWRPVSIRLTAPTPGLLNPEGRGGQVYDYYYGAGPVGYRRQIEGWFTTRIDDELILGPVQA